MDFFPCVLLVPNENNSRKAPYQCYFFKKSKSLTHCQKQLYILPFLFINQKLNYRQGFCVRLFPFLYKTLLSLNKSNFMKVRLIQQCCHRFVFIHHLCYSLCHVYFKYLLILLNIDNALVRGAYNISFMIFKCQILIHPARVQLYITAPFKSILSVPRLEMSIKKDSNLIRKAQ